jgi:hypothetical protein
MPLPGGGALERAAVPFLLPHLRGLLGEPDYHTADAHAWMQERLRRLAAIAQ